MSPVDTRNRDNTLDRYVRRPILFAQQAFLLAEGWALVDDLSSLNLIGHTQRDRTTPLYAADQYATTYVAIEWRSTRTNDQLEVLAEGQRSNGPIFGAHYLSDPWTGVIGEFFTMRLPLPGNPRDAFPADVTFKVQLTTRAGTADPGGWLVRGVYLVGGPIPVDATGAPDLGGTPI